ncbi:hypothetical protein HAPG_00003 [Halorubrum phage GNf2]|nr:hypothetical protein HAPG_00003 [Halorubrum phage GNf2]
MNEFKIKQNDTRPSLEAQLFDSVGEPQSLSTVTSVRFHMKNVSTQEVVVDSEATILNESEGKVVYEWDEGDTELDGRHVAEFEIEYENSGTETFPNAGNIDVYISDEIA